MSSNSSRQSSRARLSSVVRCAVFSRIPVQFDSERRTSATVWFTAAARIWGSDLEGRSGNVDRVETQSCG